MKIRSELPSPAPHPKPRRAAGLAETVHHLTFAADLNPSFPSIPPGYLVGGPNADLDAFANPGVSTSCAPLKCWAEVRGAYWFVEVAVNWNAPLAWLSAWLDKSGQSPRTSTVGVDSAFGGFEDRIVTPNGEGGSSAGTGGASNEGGSAGNAEGAGASGAAGETGNEPEQFPGNTPSRPARSGGGCAISPAQLGSRGLGALSLLAAAGWWRRRRRTH